MMKKPHYSHNRNFNHRVQELIRFKEANGHLDVPICGDTLTPLGIWYRAVKKEILDIKDGRSIYTSEPAATLGAEMNLERLEILEKLGFMIKVPKASEGPFPPISSKLLRDNKKKATSSSSAEKKESSNFSCRSWSEKGWYAQFKRLAEFHRIHGTATVPAKYPPDPKLGTWVRTQRSEYQRMQEGKTSNMNKERIQLLEGLAFQWSICKDALFEKGWYVQFKRLAEFHIIHGTTTVPANYPPDPKLGNWVKTQRRQYQCMQKGKTSSMNKERIQLLEGLAFKWSFYYLP